jgi:hypothetical protein
MIEVFLAAACLLFGGVIGAAIMHLWATRGDGVAE